MACVRIPISSASKATRFISWLRSYFSSTAKTPARFLYVQNFLAQFNRLYLYEFPYRFRFCRNGASFPQRARPIALPVEYVLNGTFLRRFQEVKNGEKNSFRINTGEHGKRIFRVAGGIPEGPRESAGTAQPILYGFRPGGEAALHSCGHCKQGLLRRDRLSG